MKTMKCFLIGMLILIGGYASAFTAKERSLLSHYFVEKSLKVNEIRAILYKDGVENIKPILICCQDPKKTVKLDDSKTTIQVEDVDLSEQNDKGTAVIVYRIDNRIRVTHTFISDNNRDWKEKDAIIHCYKK